VDVSGAVVPSWRPNRSKLAASVCPRDSGIVFNRPTKKTRSWAVREDGKLGGVVVRRPLGRAEAQQSSGTE
jgi:hypothetical protein